MIRRRIDGLAKLGLAKLGLAKLRMVSTGMCAVALGCLVVAVGAPATRAAAPPARAPEPGVSSVQRFVDGIAAALQERATHEGFRGGIRLSLQASRGIDVERARAVLLPRLRRALHGGPLESADGPLRARMALSEEAGAVWAVVVVEGPGIDGATTVVARADVDRELLVALGAVAKMAQGRFVLERAGVIPLEPGCAPLDAALVDGDGDPALDLAVLGRCGVTVFRIDDALRTERIGGPWPLPPRRWPRVALGWVATVGVPPHRLWVATSAGHAVVLDVRSGATVGAPVGLVPLRSSLGSQEPFALHARPGSPLLSPPLRAADGSTVSVPGLPGRLRDLVWLLGTDRWVFVAEDGTLAIRDDDGELQPLCPERVGDRVVAVDVDGDGEVELLTTAAASPGEADQLVLRRPTPDGTASTVLLKSPLGGGSIVAVVGGHTDYDARVDVMVVEEALDGSTLTLWRLRQGS
jgi:hypothetical protein